MTGGGRWDEAGGAGGSQPDQTEPRGEFKSSGAPGDDLITRNLKRVYEDIAAEPIPDALMKLLEKLDGQNDG